MGLVLFLYILIVSFVQVRLMYFRDKTGAQ